MALTVARSAFGVLRDGRQVDAYTLDNGTISATVLTYGCIVQSVLAPDRDGLRSEITIAHDDIAAFEAGHPYFGALVGRCANRIWGGGFELDGKRYRLAANQPSGAHLHGGEQGFDKLLFDAVAESTPQVARVRLNAVSPDGDQGYPGTLQVVFELSLDDADRLSLEFEATTDAPTIVNLTNHTYWNLDGAATIVDHEVRLDASRYVAYDRSMVPTGATPEVHDALDLRAWSRIGDRIDDDQLNVTGGYDHSFLVDGWTETEFALRPAGAVRAPASGRHMRVFTSYPDIHFYSGNNLSGQRGRGGTPLSGREALCMECQLLPDAPNHAAFPSIVLRPGRHYRHRTVHEFTTD